jgi:hypothetical protein
MISHGTTRTTQTVSEYSVFFRVVPWPFAGLQRRYSLSKCHWAWVHERFPLAWISHQPNSPCVGRNWNDRRKNGFSERRMETPCHRRCTIPIPAVSRPPGLAMYRDVQVPRDADRVVGGSATQEPLPRQEKVRPRSGRKAGLGHAGSSLFAHVIATAVSLREAEAGWWNRAAGSTGRFDR